MNRRYDLDRRDVMDRRAGDFDRRDSMMNRRVENRGNGDRGDYRMSDGRNELDSRGQRSVHDVSKILVHFFSNVATHSGQIRIY